MELGPVSVAVPHRKVDVLAAEIHMLQA